MFAGRRAVNFDGEDEKLLRGQLHDTRILKVLKFLEINFRLDKIFDAILSLKKTERLKCSLSESYSMDLFYRDLVSFFLIKKRGKFESRTLEGEYTVKENRRKAVLNANGLVSR